MPYSAKERQAYHNNYVSMLKSKGVNDNGINSIFHHVDLWDKNRLKKKNKHTQRVAVYHSSCINAIIKKGKPLTPKEKRSIFYRAKKHQNK